MSEIRSTIICADVERSDHHRCDNLVFEGDYGGFFAVDRRSISNDDVRVDPNQQNDVDSDLSGTGTSCMLTAVFNVSASHRLYAHTYMHT